MLIRVCVALLLISIALAKLGKPQPNYQNSYPSQHRSDVEYEVIHQNIAERFLGSLGGIIVGVLAVFLGSALLFWNEGRTLRSRVALSQAQLQCVEADASSPLPVNEGRVVHMNGDACAKEEYLVDPIFNLYAGGCIKMKRIVEMYQWSEKVDRSTQKHVGGSQTTMKKYNYNTAWSSNLIDSRTFYNSADHTNPRDMRGFNNEEFVTSEVRVGAFTLPRSMVSSFNNYQSLPLDQQRLSTLTQACSPSNYLGEHMYYCTSGDPLRPSVGDVRVSWQYVAGGAVSIVARQMGNSFAPFEHGGGSVQLLETGSKTAEQQFKGAMLSNKVFTWGLRIFGFIVIWIGFAICFEPIGVIFDVIPFLGDVARLGTGAFAFLSGIVVALTVVSVAWLFYRPLKAILILTVAMGVLYWSSYQGRAVAGSRR